MEEENKKKKCAKRKPKYTYNAYFVHDKNAKISEKQFFQNLLEETYVELLETGKI
jgi:hypothetical protein